jgi:transposase
MKAYSTDLRERILAAVDGGLSKRAAARLFGVSRSTIKRYARQRRATGSLAPQPRPAGPPPLIGPAQHDALRAQLAADPDATLAQHCATWEREQGAAVSVSTMHRAIARLGWTRKKRPSPPASGTRPSAPPGGRRSPRSIPPPSSSSTRPAATSP